MSINQAEDPPICEHHWISKHQPGLDLYWVIQCSQCGDFNAAEMNRELARVRRDAAREALDGLAEQEETSFLQLNAAGAPIAAEKCAHARFAAGNHKHTHYGEVTP